MTGAIDGSGGQVTLRSAIQAANNTPGPNTIILPDPTTLATPAASYQLTIAATPPDDNTSGDLNITGTGGDLTIQGAGAASTIIDASAIPDRVFQVGSDDTFTPPFTVTFQGLTIQKGNTFTGGGILASGSVNLVLDHVNVLDNVAGPGNGGGIEKDSSGTLTLTASTVRGNAAGSSGGGINVLNTGAVTINTSTVSGNTAITGGGINIFGPGDSSISTTTPVTITRSTISGNRASDNGGGIFAMLGFNANLTAMLTNVTISGNSAASAGGGIYATHNPGAPGSTALTLLHDTIAFNGASSGGGIFNSGPGPGNSTTISLMNFDEQVR
jgi:predicted outer membrane repeat protein